MGDPLRDRRPVNELAKKGQHIEISAKIGDFERLVNVIEKDFALLQAADVPSDWRDTPVLGRLDFSFADRDGEVAALDAELKTRVAAVCQRCLRPFEWPLQATLKLKLDESESTTEQSDGYELWELDDDTICPLEIVDEALTMALPLSARHEDKNECVDIGSDGPGSRMTTPFASLRSQMDEGQQD